MDDADRANETLLLFQRQEKIIHVVNGQDEADVLFDMLAEQGIDPAAYVDCVAYNVDLIVSHGLYQ